MLGAPGGRSSPVPSTEGTLGRLSACMTVLGWGVPPTPFHCTPGRQTSQKAAGHKGWRWGVRGLGCQGLGRTLAMCEL